MFQPWISGPDIHAPIRARVFRQIDETFGIAFTKPQIFATAAIKTNCFPNRSEKCGILEYFS